MRRRLAQTVGACPPWLLNALLRPLGALVPYCRVSQPSDKGYKAATVLAVADDGALYKHLVSHWKDPSSLVLDAREPATLLDELLMRPGVASTFQQWMTTATLTYLPDDILVKVDRAAMAVSLETRDSVPIRRKWEEHQSGARNWEHYPWDDLMFQAWREAEHA